MFGEYDYPLNTEARRAGRHAWLDELDGVSVHVGDPQQRMGTRAVAEPDWFILDEHLEEERSLTARLLRERNHDVFACPPTADEAAEETLGLVREWVSHHHPQVSHPAELGRHPLVAAASLVQDDLCLMQKSEDGWTLTAGVVRFPTYWQLRNKLDKVQQDIHGPVPHYATDLAEKVNRFFDRLPPERIVSRRNWGFSPHPLLFVPDRSLPDPPSVTGVEDLWLRSERQTLRRLPATGAILFGIRVQLAPVPALRTRPELCHRLAEAMTAWTPEMVENRGGRHRRHTELLTWLREPLD